MNPGGRRLRRKAILPSAAMGAALLLSACATLSPQIVEQACFTVAPATPEVGKVAIFSAGCSRAPSNARYAWTIEGKSYSTTTARHTFASGGEHRVTLEVTDPSCPASPACSKSTSRAVVVSGGSTPPPPPPTPPGDCPPCPASTICAEILGVASFDWRSATHQPVGPGCVGIAGGPVRACPVCETPYQPFVGIGVIAGRLELSGGPAGKPWLARNRTEPVSLELGRLQGAAWVGEFGCQYLDGRALNGAFWLLCSATTGEPFEVLAHDQVLGISLRISHPGGQMMALHDFSTFRPSQGPLSALKAAEDLPSWAVEACREAGECR